jgi:hypothetical protein
MKNSSDRTRLPRNPVSRSVIAASGAMSWLLYFVLLQLSSGFSWETPSADRPVLQILVLFAILFAIYLFASARIMNAQIHQHALPLIVVFSVAFRVLMLFSEPILEIDVYRYIWDGKAAVAGVNPFRYSPKRVLDADRSVELSHAMVRLVDVRDRSSANTAILSRIHYSELTTVYPPVSQIVFASAALVTSDRSPVATQMLIMKSVITVFDLMTFALVIALLKFMGKPAELSILYGWCPLVIKEFSNSGHLDSIAVFFTTAAVLCALKAFFSDWLLRPAGMQDHAAGKAPAPGQSRWLWLCAVCISAAAGAKIYPVVLFPLLFFGAWRVFSLHRAVAVASVAFVLSIGMIVPMLHRDAEALPKVADSSTSVLREREELLTLPEEPRTPVAEPQQPTATQDRGNTGLSAFAGHWQMNDFLFMILSENLSPDVPEVSRSSAVPPDADRPARDELPPLPGGQSGDDPSDTEGSLEAAEKPGDTRTVPWFVVTPNDWRNRIVEAVSRSTNVSGDMVPFVLTRVVTTAVFLVIALGLAIRGMYQDDAAYWLEAGFLTIAWFWMLQPTQNPWYWTWAMPLLPFARSRAWLAVSGVVFIYYLRFWLTAHYKDALVPGTPWHGAHVFDYCVTWIEFAPVLLCLMVGCWRGRRQPD